VDVRLIFATNRDLTQMVAEGSFREDLYYRLHVFPVYLPPLRERPEDIPLLARYLLHKVNSRCGKNVTNLLDETIHLLEEFSWHGNVRQLESAIEWAVISCEGDALEPRHLPEYVLPQSQAADAPVPRNNEEFLTLKKKIKEKAVSDLESEFVLAALQRNQWNVTRAAQEVGIARPNFQALMRKHGIRSGVRA
jgi:DNA-binding NtrC family response regulator